MSFKRNPDSKPSLVPTVLNFVRERRTLTSILGYNSEGQPIQKSNEDQFNPRNTRSKWLGSEPFWATFFKKFQRPQDDRHDCTDVIKTKVIVYKSRGNCWSWSSIRFSVVFCPCKFLLSDLDDFFQISEHYISKFWIATALSFNLVGFYNILASNCAIKHQNWSSRWGAELVGAISSRLRASKVKTGKNSLFCVRLCSKVVKDWVYVMLLKSELFGQQALCSICVIWLRKCSNFHKNPQNKLWQHTFSWRKKIEHRRILHPPATRQLICRRRNVATTGTGVGKN